MVKGLDDGPAGPWKPGRQLSGGGGLNQINRMDDIVLNQSLTDLLQSQHDGWQEDGLPGGGLALPLQERGPVPPPPARARDDHGSDPMDFYRRMIRPSAPSREEEDRLFDRQSAALEMLCDLVRCTAPAVRSHLALAGELLHGAGPARIAEVSGRAGPDQAAYLERLRLLDGEVRLLEVQARQTFARLQAAEGDEEAALRALLPDLDEAIRDRLACFGFRNRIVARMWGGAGKIAGELRRRLRAASAPRDPGRRSLRRLETVERAVRMTAADFLELSDVIDEAAARVQRCDFAIVEAHLPMVVEVARRFPATQGALPDYIQEGNVSLLRSLERFDRDRGTRFATYAVWGVRDAVARYIANHGRTVRLPVYQYRLERECRDARERLRTRLGRECTIGEAADELGLPEWKIVSAQATVSLSSPLRDDEGTPLGDQVADPEAHIPGEELDTEALCALLREALRCLRPLERRVLELRFGLGEAAAATYDEIARAIGGSAERARGIERKALKKLRHPSQARALAQAAALNAGSAG